MDVRVDGKVARAATGGMPVAADAPALVFIHGAGMDGSVWLFQTRHFARLGFRVLAVDLPDHGHSDGPVLSTIGEMSDWLVRFLDAAGVERATLAGHSMGSLIALDTAARHPGRVSGIALLGTSSSMQVHPDLVAAAEADAPLAPELVTDWGFGTRAHIGGHPQPGLWVMGGGLAVLMNARPGVLANDLKACAAFGETLARAAAVTCPALVLIGDGDRMTPPKAGRAVADALAGAAVEVRTIADCGHMIMDEKPYETAHALRVFLGA
ncbi:MAG: alpha/beta hydrolase [Alphaproteobacteria bacterium]|nr:alpha/beta hydrolase [Alphaproteobacteria bacterium]MDX5370296.1 alpha/beta hydrolase [Alphaproteobacteria bacterium]MDX5464832.1 alpha/beta hydrolase [Alphaproteobacteria bacterium]